MSSSRRSFDSSTSTNSKPSAEFLRKIGRNEAPQCRANASSSPARTLDPTFTNLVFPIFNHFAQQIDDAANAGRNNRTRICHRFDQRQRRPFVSRRQAHRYRAPDKSTPDLFRRRRRSRPFQVRAIALCASSLSRNEPSPITTNRTPSSDFIARDAFQKHLVVLDLSQPSDDPHQHRLIVESKLVTKLRPPARVFGKHASPTQRNHSNLIRSPDAKLLTNLRPLLLADNEIRSVASFANSLSIARNTRVRKRP